MYDYNINFGYIVQGDLRAALEYLKKFPSKKARARKYIAHFENGKTFRHKGSPMVKRICLIFDEYYRRVFWLREDTLSALQYLCDAEAMLLDLPAAKYESTEEADAALEIFEEQLAKVVEGEGYHFLGGKTQGYYGPYIWKNTKRIFYKVKLPTATEEFPVDMMTGFVSRSWMDHISFGKIGTGGWAGNDGTLACVKKCYRHRSISPKFKIDFLKHEAQHALDKRYVPDMSEAHLEYKAKLVQLIYAKNMKAFTGFVSEGRMADLSNSHALASYLLLRNLSRLVFDEELVADMALWKGKKAELRQGARRLFDDYPKNMQLD